jgi:hypothetical protein
MPITDSRLLNGTLTFGTGPVAFSCQVTNTVIEQEDGDTEDTVTVLCGETVGGASTPGPWHITGTVIQDFDAAAATNITKWSYDNRNTEQEFSSSPRMTRRPRCRSSPARCSSSSSGSVATSTPASPVILIGASTVSRCSSGPPVHRSPMTGTRPPKTPTSPTPRCRARGGRARRRARWHNPCPGRLRNRRACVGFAELAAALKASPGTFDRCTARRAAPSRASSRAPPARVHRRAPVTLRGTILPDTSTGVGGTRWGTDYGGPIHFGWPDRHIAAQPFARDAAAPPRRNGLASSKRPTPRSWKSSPGQPDKDTYPHEHPRTYLPPPPPPPPPPCRAWMTCGSPPARRRNGNSR